MNNEWITDRLPTEEDAPNTFHSVWQTNEDGYIILRLWRYVQLGEPWMRLQIPEPYVKPKRFRAFLGFFGWTVYDEKAQKYCASHLPSEQAAERIAAIYEEVMP